MSCCNAGSPPLKEVGLSTCFATSAYSSIRSFLHRVKRFCQVLLPCSLSKNLYILFKHNGLWKRKNAMLIRSKMHAWFVGHRTIVRLPLNNASLEHEECFNHLICQMGEKACHSTLSNACCFLPFSKNKGGVW